MKRLVTVFEKFDKVALSSIFTASPDTLEYENSEKALEGYLMLKRKTHALKVSIEFVCILIARWPSFFLFQAKKSIDIMLQKLKTLDSSQNTFLRDIDTLNSMLDEMLDVFGLNWLFLYVYLSLVSF